MLERKISYRVYFVAAVITAAIFLLGLTLGFVVEGKRINYAQDMIDAQQIEFTSSQLQYNYLNTLTSKSDCPTVYEIFYGNMQNLDKIAYKLEQYAQESQINEATFTQLRRQYALEQIRYWLFSGQTGEACGSDFVRLLYVYSNDQKCPDCEQQQFVLGYLKKKFGQKLLIFSLDETLEEPMIAILKKQYNITEFPTLIVEDKKITGLASKDNLLKEVCSRIRWIEFDECKTN